MSMWQKKPKKSDMSALIESKSRGVRVLKRGWNLGSKCANFKIWGPKSQVMQTWGPKVHLSLF